MLVVESVGLLMTSNRYWYKVGDTGDWDVVAKQSAPGSFKLWLQTWTVFLKVSLQLATKYGLGMDKADRMVEREVNWMNPHFLELLANSLRHSTHYKGAMWSSVGPRTC